MKRSAVLAIVSTLAACAAPQPSPLPPPRGALAPQPQSAPPPQPQAAAVPTPAPPVAPAPQPSPPPDRCGAKDLQFLVGRPKIEIPIPLIPSARRVLCTTCPMTYEFRADRQTILFDARTGLVTSVACN